MRLLKLIAASFLQLTSLQAAASSSAAMVDVSENGPLTSLQAAASSSAAMVDVARNCPPRAGLNSYLLPRVKFDRTAFLTEKCPELNTNDLNNYVLNDCVWEIINSSRNVENNNQVTRANALIWGAKMLLLGHYSNFILTEVAPKENYRELCFDVIEKRMAQLSPDLDRNSALKSTLLYHQGLLNLAKAQNFLEPNDGLYQNTMDLAYNCLITASQKSSCTKTVYIILAGMIKNFSYRPFSSPNTRMNETEAKFAMSQFLSKVGDVVRRRKMSESGPKQNKLLSAFAKTSDLHNWGNDPILDLSEKSSSTDGSHSTSSSSDSESSSSDSESSSSDSESSSSDSESSSSDSDSSSKESDTMYDGVDQNAEFYEQDYTNAFLAYTIDNHRPPNYNEFLIALLGDDHMGDDSYPEILKWFEEYKKSRNNDESEEKLNARKGKKFRNRLHKIYYLTAYERAQKKLQGGGLPTVRDIAVELGLVKNKETFDANSEGYATLLSALSRHKLEFKKKFFDASKVGDLLEEAKKRLLNTDAKLTLHRICEDLSKENAQTVRSLIYGQHYYKDNLSDEDKTKILSYFDSIVKIQKSMSIRNFVSEHLKDALRKLPPHISIPDVLIVLEKNHKLVHQKLAKGWVSRVKSPAASSSEAPKPAVKRGKKTSTPTQPNLKKRKTHK